ncbi:MAG: hypothetical protein A3F91_09735 [Flavobacteria bacterium RIFCSPLOWO2_12_FULL_35_11]|nr:MAG: hypothetical protein A3F91_09735 [Flavobacteria bacterium RIFCSPLOWO2_12_FULL_35_11]
MRAEKYKKKELKALAKKLIDAEMFESLSIVTSIISDLDENQSIKEHITKYGGHIHLGLEGVLEELNKKVLKCANNN